jgi:hypothetical protein
MKVKPFAGAHGESHPAPKKKRRKFLKVRKEKDIRSPRRD